MVTYHVRVYCEDEAVYKTTTQTTLDNTWVPGSCGSHTIRDFVIEKRII